MTPRFVRAAELPHPAMAIPQNMKRLMRCKADSISVHPRGRPGTASPVVLHPSPRDWVATEGRRSERDRSERQGSHHCRPEKSNQSWGSPAETHA